MLRSAKYLSRSQSGKDVSEPTLMEKAQALVKQPVPDDEKAIIAEPVPELQSKRSTSFGKWMSVTAVIGTVLIVSGGFLLRNHIVSVAPGMSSLYKLAGIDINLLGLEFSDIKTETRRVNGGKTLFVKGVIRNITFKTVAVPAVRVTTRAADKRALYFWFHEPDQMQLAAGQSMTFRTKLNDPPRRTSDVQLMFTGRRQQQARLN